MDDRSGPSIVVGDQSSLELAGIADEHQGLSATFLGLADTRVGACSWHFHGAMIRFEGRSFD
jgi:hypothetical protein